MFHLIRPSKTWRRTSEIFCIELIHYLSCKMILIKDILLFSSWYDWEWVSKWTISCLIIQFWCKHLLLCNIFYKGWVILLLKQILWNCLSNVTKMLWIRIIAKCRRTNLKTTFPRNKKQSLLYTLYLSSRYKEIHLNTIASNDKKLLKDAKNPTSLNWNFTLNSVSNHGYHPVLSEHVIFYF